MLDKALNRYAGRKYSALREDYSPEQAITGRYLTNESAESLTVLFPPWRGGDLFYDALTQRLLRSGSAVLRYKFDSQLLEPNVERVVDSFSYVQQSASDELKQLTLRNRYKNIKLVAASLGNVAMCLVAQKFSSFDAATFVVAGSNLAKSVWYGTRTQSLRADFEEQGLTGDDLDEAWTDLAPAESAPWFKDSEVKALMSRTDTIIPYVYQEELAYSLQGNGAHTETAVYNTGHLGTVVRYCLGY